MNGFLLFKQEIELRKKQGELGYNFIIWTIMAVIIIGALPLVTTLNDEETKWIDIIMSERYIRLIVILCIPLTVGLTAGIILIKSSIKHIIK